MVDEKGKSKSQKRQFVRLNIMRPVKYRRYSGIPVMDANFNVGKTINISGGGMMVAVNAALAPETSLDMELELTDKIRLYLVGKVLGGEDMTVEGAIRRVEKINFVNLDDESRDIIMKFIFNRQRAELRRNQADWKE